MNKVFFYVILTIALIMFGFWAFNHINPWIGIAIIVAIVIAIPNLIKNYLK